MAHFGWDQSARWHDTVPELQIDPGHKNIKNLNTNLRKVVNTRAIQNSKRNRMVPMKMTERFINIMKKRMENGFLHSNLNILPKRKSKLTHFIKSQERYL